MEILIIRSLSGLLEASLWMYFILSLSKILSKDSQKYSKSQILVLFISLVILIETGYIVKNIFPLFSFCIIYPLLFLILTFYLKMKPIKSLSIIILNIVTLIITELISTFTCIGIFKVDSNALITNITYFYIVVLLQYLLFFMIVKLANIIFKNKTEFKEMLINMNLKDIVRILLIVAICIFPQALIYVINKYNYPAYYLVLNSFQMIIVCIVIFTSFKNSMEKEKVESDLINSNLHNKTMTGMVDGVRTLKHDYNNIMQALNGYVSTKQYDKLEEHINKVLDECNIVNNLSVIDPKIFNDPAIYGIVGAKYFLATEKDIKFDIDITTDISKIEFSMPNLSRILGILLDNAIEATSKSNNKYIRLEMKYDSRKCADIIRVFNSYDTNITINLEDIYKKGVSSKKVKSGIGLWEVKKLVTKSKNSQIFANIEKDKFVQNLIIEKTQV